MLVDAQSPDRWPPPPWVALWAFRPSEWRPGVRYGAARSPRVRRGIENLSMGREIIVNNLSHISVIELKNMITSLENWIDDLISELYWADSDFKGKSICLKNVIDMLAGELDEANKELTKRCRSFVALCVAQEISVTARVTGTRDARRSGLL